MTTITETPRRYSPLWPDWCTLNDAQHENATSVIGGGQPVVAHSGPEFGIFFIDATEYLLDDKRLETRAHGELPNDDEVMTAEGLRQLAADSLAAAQWLENNR